MRLREHNHLNHAVSRTIAGLTGENAGKPAAQKDAERRCYLI